MYAKAAFLGPILNLLWVISMHLKDASCQGSSQQAELETYTLKLSKKEHYLIDLAYFSQQISKDFHVMTYTHQNPGFNATVDPTNLNIQWGRFLAFSDNFTLKDCATNISPMFAGMASSFNDGIYSRNIFGHNGTMYIVTCYQGLPGVLEGIIPATSGYNNRVEALAVTFSSKQAPVTKELHVYEHPAFYLNGSAYVGSDSVHCYTAVYIPHLKETFSVCRKISLAISTEILYVMRSGSEVTYTLFRHQGGLIANKELLKMKYLHIGGSSYEMWIYVSHFSTNLWILTFDDRQFLEHKQLSLAYCVVSIDFVAKNMIFFTLNLKCNQLAIDRRIFWYLRNPGEALNLAQPNLLVDGTFLNWYSSSEDTELIIETYKDTRLPILIGEAHSMVITLFSFDVVAKRMILSKTFVLSAYHSPMAFVSLRSIVSFHSKENSRYLLSILVTLYAINTTTGALYVEFRGNMGMWFMNDPYTGFVPSYSYNQSYNLFSQYTVGRDYRENSILFVSYGTLLSWGGIYHNCSVLRQRIKYDHLQIKNVLEDSTFFKYLNLSFQDLYTKKDMFRFNIEFLQEYETLPLQVKLWINSNDTMYQEAVQDSQKYVALQLLVRGPMVVPYLGRQYPLFIDYTRAQDRLIRYVERKMLFTIQAFPFSRLSDDLLGGSLEDCIGLLYSSSQFIFDKTYLLIKRAGFSETFVYEYKTEDDVIVRKKSLLIPSRISWAYPFKKNFFMLATIDGSIYTFDTEKEMLTDIPYVGTSCISIAVAYHLGIKTSLVCLNQNQELAYYHIDDLLSKSLIYSRLEVLDPHLLPHINHSDISSCSLHTSAEFEGKVFVYCPGTSNDRATVTIFYLEVEDALQLIYIETVDLLAILPADSRVEVDKISSFQLLADNLIVRLKGSIGIPDSITVWSYEREGYFKLMKAADLPFEWVFDPKEPLRFERHLISMSFSNAPPALLMEIYSPQNGDRNLVLMEPKSPEIETFRTTVLPRSSRGSAFKSFSVLGYTESKTRLLYAGILHWQKPESLSSTVMDFVPRVQIIYPGEPHVKTPSDNRQAYREVFGSVLVTKKLVRSAKFENIIALQRSHDKPITKAFQLIRPIIHLSTVRTRLPDIRLEYEDSLGNFTNHLESDIKIFSRPFRSVFNLSSFDWRFTPESFLDEITSSLSVSRPLELIASVQSGQDLKNILEYQNFCLKYSKPYDVSKCIQWGSVLIYQNAVIVKFDNEITSWRSKSIISYNFTNDKCTIFWLLNDNLGSLCTIGLSRKILSFNPLTLELNHSSTQSAFNFDPQRTVYKQASVQSVSFLMLSSIVSDDFNRRGIGRSLLYIYSGDRIESETKSPQTGLCELLITDIEQADQVLEPHYNVSNSGFYVLINSVAVGKYKQLKFSARITVDVLSLHRTRGNQTGGPPVTGGLRHERMGERAVRFSTPDCSRVKEEIFAHVQLLSLLFDSKEQYSSLPNFVDDISNTLIHLPNYHSYLVRYSGIFHPCNSSIYRLWNVFTIMMNEYIAQTPSCHFWACALVYRKGSAAFVSLYDLNFEEIRANKNSNFAEIFSTEAKQLNCSAGPETDVFDLTMIPKKYTRYPLQILNFTDIERVQFDNTVRPYIYTKANLNETFSESKMDYSLRLQVFHTDGRVSIYTVSRSMSVLLKLPSVSSEFLKVKIIQSNSVKTKFNIWIPSYLMQKQRIIPVCIYLTGLVLVAGSFALFLRNYLDRQRNQAWFSVQHPVNEVEIPTEKSKITATGIAEQGAEESDLVRMTILEAP